METFTLEYDGSKDAVNALNLFLSKGWRIVEQGKGTLTLGRNK